MKNKRQEFIWIDLGAPNKTRWWEYLSCFNYDTIHVDGDQNRVADTLSCYFEYDTIEDKIPNTDFVKADEILDPDGDLVPIKRFVEIRTNVTRRSHRLQDRMEPAITESKELNQIPMRPLSVVVSDNNDVVTTNAGNNKTLLLVKVRETFNLIKAVRHAY